MVTVFVGIFLATAVVANAMFTLLGFLIYRELARPQVRANQIAAQTAANWVSRAADVGLTDAYSKVRGSDVRPDVR